MAALPAVLVFKKYSELPKTPTKLLAMVALPAVLLLWNAISPLLAMAALPAVAVPMY